MARWSPATLNSYERMVVHRICEKLGLDSKAHGQKPNRFVGVATKKREEGEGGEGKGGRRERKNTRQRSSGVLGAIPARF